MKQADASATTSSSSLGAPVRRFDVTTSTLIRVVLALGAVWLLTKLWPVVVIVVAGLIIAGTVNPAVDWLESHHFRRAWAVAAVYLGVASVLGLLGVLVGPPLWDQLVSYVDHAPALRDHAADLLSRSRIGAPLAAAVRHVKFDKLASGDLVKPLSYSTAILVVLGYIATSVVLSLYFVADRDRTRGALFAVVPKRHHVRLARVLIQLETIVGHYMRGQLITSVLIAIFTFALLALFRVPGALPIAVFAGLTDTIPFVGGLLATVPAGLAAFAHGGTGTMLAVGGILVAYQEFESRVIVPHVYGRALRLPAAAVIVALLVGGILLGIVGALLALPVTAALRMLVDELRVELPGDDSHDPVQEARDEREEALYAQRTSGADPSEAAAVAVSIAARDAAATAK